MDILPPGSLIGKYPITRLMSAGGMGLIYEAVHPVLGSRVVIKTIRSELAHDPQIIERFFKEALATSRVRDERLPQIFDQDRLDDHTPYIVMELLEGEDLAARLTKGPLPYEYAARVVVEILEVLHRVHQLGIVHRDLKPQNIFLARSDLLGEVPKLLDFGVAHFMGEQSTQPGQMMGTPLYMALEQAEDSGRIGPWTDVFAAGVVLYECLAGAGQRPWGSPNVMGYLARLKSGVAPRPLSDAAPQTPPGLCDAVHRALTIEPSGRFPDAAMFARALEPFAQSRTAMFQAVPSVQVTVDTGADTPPPQSIANDDTVFDAPSAIRTSAARQRTIATATLQKLHRRLSLLGPERSARNRMDRLRAGERRYVTLLALSMRITSSLPETEPEDFDAVADQVFEVFLRVLARADAHVEPPMGWSLIAAFGHEHTREDDAERAVAAGRALIAQQRAVDGALGEYGYGLSVRLGLHSGFVTRTARGGRDVVTGDTAEVARQLAEAAPVNGLCISRETCAIVGSHYRWRPLGAIEVKGRPRPIEAYEVLRDGLSTDVRTRPGAARTFVGRADAIEALEMEYLLASVQSGEVRVVQVMGPAGAGKSRLIDEFIRRLGEDTNRETTVLRAQPIGLHPYSLWASVLRQVLFDTDVSRPATQDVIARLNQLAGLLDRPSAAELRRQTRVAHLVLGRGDTEPPEQTDPEVFGGRVRSLLALVLTAASRRATRIHGRPLVVVLDDLHRADQASLELAWTIPGMIRDDMPPLFLTGSRSTKHELDDWVHVELLPLGPIDDDAVDKLIDDLAGNRPVSSAVRAMVKSRAGGNPLFVEELVGTLRTRRQLDASAEELSDMGPPGSLFGLLLSRLERLPKALREAVRHLSVSGAEVDPRIWSKVASQIAEEQRQPVSPEDQLAQLAEFGVLEPSEVNGRFIYRFRQQLLRDAIYGTVLPHNRRLLHLRYAEAIEARQHRPDAESSARLLYHYSHTDADEKTVKYARRVGRRRLSLAAYAEALSALQLATMIQDRLDVVDVSSVATLIDLSTALFYLGRLDDSSMQAQRALSDAPADDDRLRARAHVALARARQYGGGLEDARTHLEQAEYLFDRAGEPLWAARARSTLAFVIRGMGGSLEEALELARSGWAILRDSNVHPAIVRAGHDLGNILRDLGRYEEALAVFEHAIAVGETSSGAGPFARLPWLQACRSGRAIALAALGRLDEAIEVQRQVYAHAVQIRHRVAQAVSAFHLARHLADNGEREAAEEMAETCLEVCGEVGMPGRAMKARLLLARLAKDRGDTSRQRQQLEAAEFLARDRGDAVWFGQTVVPLVRLLARLGERGRAEGLLAEAGRRARVTRDPTLTAQVRALAAELE